MFCIIRVLNFPFELYDFTIQINPNEFSRGLHKVAYVK